MRAALALVSLLASPALAQSEEAVTIDTPLGPVIGTLETPAGDPAPVVLLFHGFTGVRDELPVANTDEGVFSRTARLLAEQGIASLRIDFRGSGESPGAFADTTFEGQVADGLAALAWLEANPAVDGQRLGVIGWSQGGLVATAVAGRSDKPDALVLWAAVANPEESFGGIVGAETIAKGLEAGDAALPVTLPWGAVVELKRGFFEGVTTFDPPAELASYAGPLFIAHGTLDTTVLPTAVGTFLAAHDGEESKWLAEMDHVFNAFTGPETLDQMVGETVAFLKPHLQ
ncbi:S9 family peptidase [Tabrizicola sp.]|uniref:alpha/beta hydrolase family protein n=1 Tax=Tabrizicola sp. TaxID=2005166 RepID=UPI002736677D|nr:alpha/beta fold hydrolase [Tabrizicola sp.]MDP3196043.1 alpha/beta fold hydrolase [Tabrizicola sp.]